MRLTNVAQMQLVAGRVSTYARPVTGEPGRELPISFDQGRHVGEGQRPGSWMALAMRLAVPATREELAAAWDVVVDRHGTLRTAFSRDEEGELHLHEVQLGGGRWVEHAADPEQLSREVLREALDAECAPFERPSHRLCLVEPAAGSDELPELVLAADHSHLDMWSLVVLANDLLVCLDDARSGRPLGGELAPARAFAEHTAQLDAMPPAPEWVPARWATLLDAGGGAMPVFPLPLGELVPRPAEVVEVRDVLDAAETARFAAIAQASGVRMLSLGLSVLTEVTARMSGAPLRAVFPVHSRHEPGWRDAVGWFITNAVIECKDPSPAACAAAVTEATTLGSWPLKELLAPYGGIPARPGMFAISWLDTRRLPVPPEHATHLRYVSARIRTDGVMIWFLVNASGLHLRCRYPDTPEARANVGRWLDAVQTGIRELTAEHVAG